MNDKIVGFICVGVVRQYADCIGPWLAGREQMLCPCARQASRWGHLYASSKHSLSKFETCVFGLREMSKIYQSMSVDNPKVLCIEYNSLLIAFRCRQRTAKTWRSSWRPRSSSVPPRTGWTWTKRSTNLFASSVASRLKPVPSFAIVTPWKTNGNHEKKHVIIAKIINIQSIVCRLLSGPWLRAKGRRLQGRKGNVLSSSPLGSTL